MLENNRKLRQEVAAKPWIDTHDPENYKQYYKDRFLLGVRNENSPGAYEKFRENFDPKNYYNMNRKSNLINKNMQDYHSEQRRLDVMQSFFMHEHKKDMNAL